MQTDPRIHEPQADADINAALTGTQANAQAHAAASGLRDGAARPAQAATHCDVVEPARAPATVKACAKRATLGFMLSHPLHIVSLGFGSGLSPFMPGTMGTLFAWAAFALLDPYLSETAWGALIGVGFIAGIGVTGFTARKLGRDDPSPVVWDEVVGFWLVLLMIRPASFTAQLTAFATFRFFDMVKPPPVGYFDRHYKGGLGIMLDDLAAAFMALLVLAAWHWFR